MREQCSFLNQYSLEEHYTVCKQYLKQMIDWDKISTIIRQDGVAHVDISNVISLFSHLELDDNYKLICYLASEYHGVWGRIAAIKNGAEKEPVFNSKTKRPALLFMGKNFELPESASPPMEAIYHDGTDEGFLEAVLCSLFLKAIPYTLFENPQWDRLMSEPPSSFNENWDAIVNIADWTPRRVGDTIVAFKREMENGLGSSDGRDRIYLTQFAFEKSLGLYHAFKNKGECSMYKNQINDDKRYNKNRHCCVFVESKVLIAVELEAF